MQVGTIPLRLSSHKCTVSHTAAAQSRLVWGKVSQRRHSPCLRQSTAFAEVASAAQSPAAPAEPAPQEPAPAAAEPEPEYDTVTRLKLRLGSANIPHPEKVDYGGEDAYFLSEVGGGALGVADGVGGWADSEVNPAEYAKTFMQVSKLYLEGKDVRMNEVNGSVQLLPVAGPTDTWDGDGERTPQGALDAGHVATRLPGSSTACIVQLNRDVSTVSAANLGDSGFILVRNGYVTFRSPVLQHFFDCPLQFGAVPEHTNASDYAEDADLFELGVQVGDIIIAASDGLWDNCRDEELLKALRAAAPDVNRAAQSIAELARRNAADDSYESPYTVEALRQGIDLSWWEKLKKSSFSPKAGGFKLGRLSGGKMDDITVLVALVAEETVNVPRAAKVEPEASSEEEASEETTSEALPAAESESGEAAALQPLAPAQQNCSSPVAEASAASQ